jgi:uncharacterized protein YggE
MKRFSLLFFGVFLSLFFSSAHGQQAALTPVRSITVSGESVIKAAPDKADLMITLYREGKEIAQAKQQVDRLLDTLREIASDYKIAEKDLRTQYTSIQPQYDYSVAGKPRLNGYVAQHSIVVTVRDMEKLGDLMQTMVERGIDRVDNISYGLQKEDALKEEALIQALAVARRKAERLAQAAGNEAGGALTIQESGAFVQPPQPPMPMMMRAEMSSMAQDKAAAPPAGEVEIRSSVTASYLLK